MRMCADMYINLPLSMATHSDRQTCGHTLSMMLASYSTQPVNSAQSCY